MKEKGVFISLINKLMLRMKMLARKRGEILKQTDRQTDKTDRQKKLLRNRHVDRRTERERGMIIESNLKTDT